MKYSVGDEFPEVLFNWMDDKFEVQKAGSGELFDNKNVILIGMPGAFSPTCSMMHLPGFIKSVKEFKDFGIDEIFCVFFIDFGSLLGDPDTQIRDPKDDVILGARFGPQNEPKRSSKWASKWS